MAKAVLISIRPKWCEKIANGEKTVEVRKTRSKTFPGIAKAMAEQWGELEKEVL